MLDIDAGKLLIVGVIALLVIGPKELPRVLRQIGQWTGKLRRMAQEFQGQFMDAMREADLESLKQEVTSVAASARVETTFDPVADIHREVTSALESKAPAVEKPSAPAAITGPTTESLPALPSQAGGTPPPMTSPEPAASGMAAAPTAATPVSASAESIPHALREKAHRARSAGKPTVLIMSQRIDAVAAAARRRTMRTHAAAASAVRKRPGLSAVRPTPAAATAPTAES